MLVRGITDPAKMIEAANEIVRKRLSDKQQTMLAEIAKLLIPDKPEKPAHPFKFTRKDMPTAEATMDIIASGVVEAESNAIIDLANKVLGSLPLDISFSLEDAESASKAVVENLPAYLSSRAKT